MIKAVLVENKDIPLLSVLLDNEEIRDFLIEVGIVEGDDVYLVHDDENVTPDHLIGLDAFHEEYCVVAEELEGFVLVVTPWE